MRHSGDTPQPLLEIRNLTTGFEVNGQFIQATERVNLRIHEKEILCLVGESGSGKSVTALSILGLVDGVPGIVEGEIWFQNRNLLQGLTKFSTVRRNGAGFTIRKDTTMWLRHHASILRSVRGRSIAMVFQDPLSALNPFMTIGQQLSEVLRKVHRSAGRREVNERALDWLQKVRIPDPRSFSRSYPFELSGGMCQRAMLAIALANEPALLIADEPTTALDAVVQFEILSLLDELRNLTSASMLIITHDLAIAANFADTIAVMYAGRVVESGRREHLLNGGHLHPYTNALLESAMAQYPAGDNHSGLAGVAPDPASLPRGCKFHPRCQARISLPDKGELCLTSEPDDVQLQESHWIRCWKYREDLIGTRGGSDVA